MSTVVEEERGALEPDEMEAKLVALHQAFLLDLDEGIHPMAEHHMMLAMAMLQAAIGHARVAGMLHARSLAAAKGY